MPGKFLKAGMQQKKTYRFRSQLRRVLEMEQHLSVVEKPKLSNPETSHVRAVGA
jgi:hypothetical protein